MEADVEGLIGAGRHERSADRLIRAGAPSRARVGLGFPGFPGDLVEHRAAGRDRADTAVDRIEWPEGFCRRDIGAAR